MMLQGIWREADGEELVGITAALHICRKRNGSKSIAKSQNLGKIVHLQLLTFNMFLFNKHNEIITLVEEAAWIYRVR